MVTPGLRHHPRHRRARVYCLPRSRRPVLWPERGGIRLRLLHLCQEGEEEKEQEQEQEEEEEEEEEEEGLFKANAVNEEDPERDCATQV